MVFRCSRRVFVGGAALSWLSTNAAASEASVSFLVVGDWGQPHSAPQHAVAAAMGNVASQMASRFVISTGDNFYRRGVDSVDDPQWRETFEDVYAASSLQTPWYVVLGNHDYEGSPEAELSYTQRSSRWRMPARYWREDMIVGARSIAMFFLDTTPIVDRGDGAWRALGRPSDADEQLAWLEAQLALCRADWKIVVGHHPVLSSGNHGGSRLLATRLQPLLERYRVHAYFNGHDHDLEHLQSHGVNYICSGSGSSAREVDPLPQSLFAYADLGFAACQLSEDVLRLKFHGQAGDLVYAAEIARG